MARFLVFVYPRLLLAAAAIWPVAALLAWGPAMRRIPAVKTCALAALMAVAAGLALAMPRTHRVYFDEFDHLNIASNVARTGSFAESLASNGKDFDVLDVPTWPGLFHVLLARAYSIWGDGDGTAFAFNLAISTLGIFAVFAAGAAWFGLGAGLFAAALWTALPLRATFGAACDLTPCSLFWIAAALAALGGYLRRGDRPRLGFLVLTLVLCANARFENAVLIALGALLIARNARRDPWGCAAAFVGLAAGLTPPAAIAALNHAKGIPGFDAGLAALAAGVARQLPRDALFLVASPLCGLAVAPAAAYAFSRDKSRPETRLLAAAAGLFLLVYCCFFRGDFFHGTEDRYALSPLLALCLLAGQGLAKLPRTRRAMAVCWTGAALGLSWLIPGPGLNPAHEGEYRMLQRAAKELPRSDYVAAFSPAAVLTTARRPSVGAYLVLSDTQTWRARLDDQPVILFKDYWWSERPDQAAALEKELSRTHSFSSLMAEEDGGRRYEFLLGTPIRR